MRLISLAVVGAFLLACSSSTSLSDGGGSGGSAGVGSGSGGTGGGPSRGGAGGALMGGGGAGGAVDAAAGRGGTDAGEGDRPRDVSGDGPTMCPPCAAPPQPSCRGTGPCGCGPYVCPDSGAPMTKGDAAPDGAVTCGANVCQPGTRCCNPLRGICTPPGVSCIQ